MIETVVHHVAKIEMKVIVYSDFFVRVLTVHDQDGTELKLRLFMDTIVPIDEVKAET